MELELPKTFSQERSNALVSTCCLQEIPDQIKNIEKRKALHWKEKKAA